MYKNFVQKVLNFAPLFMDDAQNPDCQNPDNPKSRKFRRNFNPRTYKLFDKHKVASPLFIIKNAMSA